MQIPAQIQEAGIDLLDVGCSGALDPLWRPIQRILNVTGFDPNAGECERLSQSATGFKTARYLPWAISGEAGEFDITLTQSPACSSLLKPRHAWLERFHYAHLFKEVGAEKVKCDTLEALGEKEALRADVLKLDTQGMEMPILRSAGKFLDNAICVQTETGYVENYVGETVAAEVDEFMRGQGFLLFDVKVHCVGRNNAYLNIGKHQPLWCECTWLRDFLSDKSFGIPAPTPDGLTALKAVFIASFLGYADYGFELSEHFAEQGILGRETCRAMFPSKLDLGRICCLLLRVLPKSVRAFLHRQLTACLDQQSLVRAIVKRLGRA